MAEGGTIRIGNQTAYTAATPTLPFEYALANGFDAFEWFPDKKAPNAGWDAADFDAAQRAQLQTAARARGLRVSVHATGQSNPLWPESRPGLLQDVAFATDLGAALLNVHLYPEAGSEGYVQAIDWLVDATASAGLQLAIENTPDTAPFLFNELFTRLRALHSAPVDHVGMCLDLGHANLCQFTRNDYLGYLDQLDPSVPIIHVHLHENWGDCDSHLPLFTGPAGRRLDGVHGFLARLRARGYHGSFILEQWPDPPTLLNDARDRLQVLLAELGIPLHPQNARALGPRRTAPELGDPTGTIADVGEQIPPFPLTPTLSLGEREDVRPLPVNLGAPQSASGPGVSGQPSKAQIASARSLALPLPKGEGRGEGEGNARTRDGGHALGDGYDRCGELGAFGQRLVTGNQRARSWREKLDLVRELLGDSGADLGGDQLVDLAIYCRFLAAGEITCVEDGRHFRPSHHARISLAIQERLARFAQSPLAYLVRKVLPWLPATGRPFVAAEPLTRIRDIAHRNDIPPELKREIKHTLQNKLHRCASPADLATSAALLQRITAPGADYAPDFVAQFQTFHRELQEFFSARALDEQLEALAAHSPPVEAQTIRDFLTQKKNPQPGLVPRLALLVQLTKLRQHFLGRVQPTPGPTSQACLLADIGLENYAFVLLSELLNDADKNITEVRPDAANASSSPEWVGRRSPSAPPGQPSRSDKPGGNGASHPPGLWPPLLEALELTLANLRLSAIALPETALLEREIQTWRRNFVPSDGDPLLRLQATLNRCGRLAEGHSQGLIALCAPRAATLGRALGVGEQAIRNFCESEIRGQLIFQFAKLTAVLAQMARASLGLPPWEVLSVGQAAGRLLKAATILALPATSTEPVVGLISHCEGDEEIPSGITGLILAHPLPHLSHLAVRARQAHVVLVSCDAAGPWDSLAARIGQHVLLSATREEVRVERTSVAPPSDSSESSRPGLSGSPALKVRSLSAPADDAPCRLLPLSEATVENAGSKAVGVRRLSELSQRPEVGFKTPPSWFLPFSVLEQALRAQPDLAQSYRRLVGRLHELPPPEIAAAAAQLREWIHCLALPPEVLRDFVEQFRATDRLMIRSSANFEDLEHFSGAGLHESVANVPPLALADAVRRVWASLWTQRAAVSRQQAGLPQPQARMAILVQRLVVPEYSFILHTVHPLTRNPKEIYLELAVGLGQTLATGTEPGAPYRLAVAKSTGQVRTLHFADFSRATWPDPDRGLCQRPVDYSQVPLSCDPSARVALGRRLAAVGRWLEEALDGPQDVEGVVRDADLYLVQVRPQAGLAEVSSPPPIPPKPDERPSPSPVSGVVPEAP